MTAFICSLGNLRWSGSSDCFFANANFSFLRFIWLRLDWVLKDMHLAGTFITSLMELLTACLIQSLATSHRKLSCAW